MEIKNKLKHFGGNGCFSKVLSTSNLYQPDIKKVTGYLLNSMHAFGSGSSLSDLLEERLCEYHNAEYCVLFSSGFWALVAAIKLKADDGAKNVIIPSMTYRRLADVVHWADKTPVFVDVNEHDLAISVKAVQDSLDADTALILAVHPIVNCCDVDAFIRLSVETDVPLIFDAVESVHETYRGKRIGSFGYGEVFSFHASKLINGCEGGYVCTNDELFASQLRALRNLESVNAGHNTVTGINARPLGEHSAFALAGLDEIDLNVSHNKEIYGAYKQYIADVGGLKLVEFDESEQTSFKNIVVEVLDDYPMTRDELVDFLNKEGLLARSHYDPPLHAKQYEYDVIIKDMKNTSIKHIKYINMPCGSIVTTTDVKRISQLLEFISSSGCFSIAGSGNNNV